MQTVFFDFDYLAKLFISNVYQSVLLCIGGAVVADNPDNIKNPVTYGYLIVLSSFTVFRIACLHSFVVAFRNRGRFFENTHTYETWHNQYWPQRYKIKNICKTTAFVSGCYLVACKFNGFTKSLSCELDLFITMIVVYVIVALGLFGIVLISSAISIFPSINSNESQESETSLETVPSIENNSTDYSIRIYNLPTEELPSCAICLDVAENGTLWKDLICGHTFHTNCILTWFQTSSGNTCPVCRQCE
jgi:hypothetical protein